MAETKCLKCGASLESEDELCMVCDAGPESVTSPSQMAPPPPSPADSSAVQGWPPQVVGDIMTRKVATLFEGEPLGEAAKGLRKVKFRHVPVVGSDGYLIGLVSQRDLLRALPSSLEPDASERTKALLERHRVGDIMARDVRTVSATTSLEDAGQIMIDDKRDCLPVVDAKGILIGLVTATDFLRLALGLLKKV
ncbi:MAG: CBS domain-containing protein [Myxococcota bacterium]